MKNLYADSLYETNKKFFEILLRGYTLKREDKSKTDLLINLIDFKNVNNNIFKFVNQFEIIELEKRIPDGIVFVNGIPLVVSRYAGGQPRTAGWMRRRKHSGR